MRPLNRDTFPHLLATALDVARAMRDTAVARLLARFWGVELGEGVRFYGVPIVRRLPGTRIRIGARCELRSAPWSNQVGLVRACSLATIADGACIEIGEGTGLSGAAIGAGERVVIGREVLVGANCTITDSDWHAVTPQARREGARPRCAPVVIEDGVWLSMGVTVLKGVTIGAGTVVAAGSVVSRSLPAGVLAAGSPAVALRKIELGRVA